MEYSVGSLADLISGSNTPNKSKVFEKNYVLNKSGGKKGTPTPKNKGPQSPQKKGTPTPQKKGAPTPQKTPQKSPKKMFQPKVESPLISSPQSQKKNRKRKSSITVQALEMSEDEEVAKDSEESEDEAMASDDSDESEDEKPVIKNEESDDEDEKPAATGKKTKADPERQLYPDRTIYVGNVPKEATKIHLKRLFKKFGQVETVRLRCAAAANPKDSLKVAVIKKELHPKRTSLTAFVRFVTREDALKALVFNGQKFKEHHLRVKMCDDDESPDENKAIFIGNVSFDAEEEALWKLFEPYGTVASVRLIRDRRTGMGKGFGYVNFESADSVELALQLENVKLNNRELRISRCNVKAAKKQKDKGQESPMKKAGTKRFFSKKIKTDIKTEVSDDGDVKPKIKNSPKKDFQGTDFGVMKKKKKFSKDQKQKKFLSKKLMGKPKTA